MDFRLVPDARMGDEELDELRKLVKKHFQKEEEEADKIARLHEIPELL